MRRIAFLVALAVLGIVLTAAITWGTSQLVRQRIGLSSEPLSAGRRLLPSTAANTRKPSRPTRTVTRTVLTPTPPTRTQTQTAPGGSSPASPSSTSPSGSSPASPATTSPPVSSPSAPEAPAARSPARSGGESSGSDSADSRGRDD